MPPYAAKISDGALIIFVHFKFKPLKLDLYFLMTYPYVKFELNVLFRWGDNERKLKFHIIFKVKGA
jgi:hypothetical protein